MATIFWLSIHGLHIGATWQIRLNCPRTCGSASFAQLMAESPYTFTMGTPFPKNYPFPWGMWTPSLCQITLTTCYYSETRPIVILKLRAAGHCTSQYVYTGELVNVATLKALICEWKINRKWWLM